MREGHAERVGNALGWGDKKNPHNKARILQNDQNLSSGQAHFPW